LAPFVQVFVSMIGPAPGARIGAFCHFRVLVSTSRVAAPQSRLISSSRARFFPISQLNVTGASTRHLLCCSRSLVPSSSSTWGSASTFLFTTSAGHLHDTSPSSGQSAPVSESAVHSSAPSTGNSSVNKDSSSTRATDPLDLSDLLPKSNKASRSDGVWDSILAMTSSELLPRSTQNDRWEKHHENARKRMAETKLEAGKYAGRSVNVTEFVPLRIALGRLGRILGQNNMRKELRLVERYEKPTDKRRRLKSERHRRRFAEMIAQKVRVVREIRARGG